MRAHFTLAGFRIDTAPRFVIAVAALCAACACGSENGSRSASGGNGSGARGASAGDSAGGNGGTGGGTEPDANEFCPAFVDAFAGYLADCSCDAATVANYRTFAASFCEPEGFLGSLPAAVAAGDFSYDAQAAQRLLARLARPNPSCLAGTFLALELDSVELYSLAGTFVGTHALGGACSHPVGFKGGISDCREGVCAPNAAGSGVCISFVGVGEECDGGGDERFSSTSARLCHEVRLGDQDGEYATSFERLACLPSPSNPNVRTCQSDLADGEPCQSNIVCHSGFCAATGVCMPKLASGEACEASDDCASGACHDGDVRVCGPLLADGEPCGYSNEACTSGHCNDLVDPVVCGAPPNRAVGETCSASAECLGDGPNGPFDRSCHDGHCIHDVCEEFLP